MSINQLQSIEDIFDGRFLRIPDYQRGYAWGERQLKDFWEDLENLESSHVHYTGVLTLEKVTQEKKKEKIEFWKSDSGAYDSEKAYYIVDGQQRVTTSIILLKVLLDKVGDAKWFAGCETADLLKKYIGKKNQNGTPQYFFGYTADNPSYEFLKTKIFGDKSTSNEKKETLYTTNLENAKDFFEKKIQELAPVALELVFNKLTKQIKFNVYEIADDLDVFVAFETMNNRGKKLSNLELLKNRLIYLSTKFKDDDKVDLRTSVNDCWKTIYEYLGKNKKNPLDDDIFLKNHWTMYHEYSRKKGNDYIVDLLEERYTTKKILNNELSIADIRDYVLSLKESVEHWYNLFNPEQSSYDEKIKFLLDKLYRLNYAAFAPLLMAIFSRDDKYDVGEICKLLTVMERYIFIIFKISQRRANTGDSEFYGYARKYYQGKIVINDIIGVKNNDKDEYSGINWWMESYFDLNQFKIYLSDKFKNQDGYYSWSGLGYFLFEYELSLQAKSKNVTKQINWSDYKEAKGDSRSIEHVMPQTLDKQCWINKFQGIDEKKLKYICNSLGNLVPLSSPKNSKLQNNCFDKKKEDGYKHGSYSEQEINEKSEWAIREIKERGIKLLNFLADHWCIEGLKDESLQVDLLYLPAVDLSDKKSCDSEENIVYSKEDALNEMRKDGGRLMLLSEQLKADKDVVMEAVKSRGNALEYASEKLRANKKIVLMAVENGMFALSYASDELREDKEVVLKAVRKYPFCIEYAGDKIRSNREIILELSKVYGRVLELINDDLRDDREIVLNAVMIWGRALEFASEKLRADRDIVVEAIRNDSSAIQYASNDLKNDAQLITEIGSNSSGNTLAHYAAKNRDEIQRYISELKSVENLVRLSSTENTQENTLGNCVVCGNAATHMHNVHNSWSSSPHSEYVALCDTCWHY